MGNKQKNILLGVLIVGIISMTVAFATLSVRLNIGGTAEVAAQNWKIVIDDWTRVNNHPSLVSGQTNTAEEVTPGTPATNTVSVSGLKVRFKQPGDTIKYTFNIENQGTIDAELQSWSLTTPTCTSNNETVDCPVTREVKCGEVDPEVGDTLAANSTIACTYIISYPEVNGSNGYSSSQIDISNLGATWNYVQKTSSSGGNTPVVPTKQAITFEVGDLVEMTPAPDTTTADYDANGKYIIKGSETGYYTNNTTKALVDQTIDPTELNVWRIIKVNGDGSAEAVSEYVSSVNVYFKGVTGYAKYIGTLNEIASQYENSTYTTGSRYMGYSNQTETISDTSKFDDTYDVAALGAPWKCSTGGTCSPAPQDNEALGGGDTGYETDINAVKTAYNDSLVAKKVGKESATNYWLASRYYGYNSDSYFRYIGRNVSASGNVDSTGIRFCNDGWGDNRNARALRPIITLKSGIEGTGTGVDGDPYVLE